MRLPQGFTSSAVAAGLKPSGLPDLAVLVADRPMAWAFTGTKSRLVAPCVARNRLRYDSGDPVRAVVVNSGNANCATNEAGIDNEEIASRVAGMLGGGRPQDVLTASTGVIGVPMPMTNVREGLFQVFDGLAADSDAFAEAILTTDTRTKQIAATLKSGSRIVGVAKGSGMIHPNMGTMLAFVMTDAMIPQATLRELWSELVDSTFNQVTVDGDTSPNDMALLLSSQRSEANMREFEEGLEAVVTKLAEKIASDGEGASTMIRVHVVGARDVTAARQAARAVAGSNLVKAAIHGRDPNWGRILSAIGQTGVLWDMASMDVCLQGTPVFENGSVVAFDDTTLSKALDAEIVEIYVNLSAGEASAWAWGCDLTEGYVAINAHYTT